MKILLTGGGSGGHFYPVVAVAQELREIIADRKLIDAELFYMSDSPYNKSILFDNGIQYVQVSTGKYRLYFSIKNFIDLFKTAWGVTRGLWKVFSIYPDVIFGKGGYASFPALLAGKILGIPVIIHESDTVPGKVNLWAGKFAKKIALSYPDAEQFFPKDKVAWTGNPIRKDITIPTSQGALEFFNLEPQVPILFIMGGSQGSALINDEILKVLPTLLNSYQIIHQTGTRNITDVKATASVIIERHEFKNRYKTFEYLNPIEIRMAAGVADLVITRAGSTLFEIAAWGLPSIVIPIEVSNGDHQRKNAFAYARTGAAVVIEENNLTSEILVAQIKELIGNTIKLEKMKVAARGFARLDAAHTIADAILTIALSHE